MIVAHSITPFLFLTGSWIYNQIRFPGKCRHLVLTTRKANLEQFPFQPIFSTEDLSTIRGFFERAFRKLLHLYLPYWYHICKKEHVRLLHSHFGWAGAVDLSFAEKLGVPHVVSFYGADILQATNRNPHLRTRYLKLFGEVSRVFVEGPYAKEALVNTGCPREKIVISHLGVEMDAIMPLQRVWNPDETFRILIVGTFTQKKGILLSLKAIERILHSPRVPKIEINIVGNARETKEDQRTKSDILEFVSSSLLRERTKFHGFLPFSTLMSMAYHQHLLMQTSVHADDGDCEGGFPVVITDMMASGMPVIASTHCDIPEILKHGRNGLLAAERDLDATSDALLQALGRYNSFSKECFNFNRRFLRDEFDARTCALKREAIYQELVERSS
jgi:colanic acid/amylovoran biosynthesis glycosyltransferase